MVKYGERGGKKGQKMKDNPTPRRKSYTQSFARDCKDLLVLSMPGVGNVGDFKKTFVWGGEKERVFGRTETSDFFA